MNNVNGIFKVIAQKSSLKYRLDKISNRNMGYDEKFGPVVLQEKTYTDTKKKMYKKCMKKIKTPHHFKTNSFLASLKI